MCIQNLICFYQDPDSMIFKIIQQFFVKGKKWLNDNDATMSFKMQPYLSIIIVDYEPNPRGKMEDLKNLNKVFLKKKLFRIS